jgi:mRNA-degrading endonuclease RelE of RelBE toxin-antitoxin system
MPDPRYAVRLATQAVSFLKAQSPETRRRLRLALRGLAQGRGDIKGLEGGLEGYHRLRVGATRVILRYGATSTGAPAIFCVFAERRSLVYLLLEDLLARGLRHPASSPSQS